jgi:S-adenosylmethionine decarboxylase proenzyme
MELINNINNNQLGTHLIVDLIGIPNHIFLNELNKEKYEAFGTLVELSLSSHGMNILKKDSHFFDSPTGAFTIFYLLSESHLSMHSWPEHNYIALDIFTCGNVNTLRIVEEIISYLKPESFKINKINRGK